jgi:elongation factor P hydroxylase
VLLWTVYQTTIFTRCYYGGSIHELLRWHKDIDGKAPQDVESDWERNIWATSQGKNKREKYLGDLPGKNKREKYLGDLPGEE